MKKVLVILGIFLMLSTSMFGQKDNMKYAVMRKTRYLVDAPQTYSIRIATVGKGDTILVYMNKHIIPYYKVEYNGKVGYIDDYSFRVLMDSEIRKIDFTNISTITNNQKYYKTLKIKLYKTHKTTKIGLDMFFGGLATTAMGIIFMNASETGEDAAAKAGLAFAIIGGVSTTASIPIMVIGNKRATEVLFQMIQYEQQYNINTNNISMGIGVRKTF